METVSFNVGKGYRAIIGAGALMLLGEAASAVPGRRAALIKDSRLPEEHAAACVRSLESAGFAVTEFSLEAGEKKKSLAAVEELYGFFFDSGLTRADCVAALGGGVVGDTAGFAAATYLRGIPFFSVPTTVLAQVDSAYGGKTGVDFRSGKNFIGCFAHPAAVICDTDLLLTLPEAERASGMGEIIKYGAIADPSILERVSRALPDAGLIAECADIKRRFVEADEFDFGERRILNFGHTFGHGIEEASGYSVPHGQAVAYGMLAAVRLGEKLGATDPSVFGRLDEAIINAGLLTDYEQPVRSALPYLSRDKKSDGKTLDFILLSELGKPFRKKLSLTELVL